MIQELRVDVRLRCIFACLSENLIGEHIVEKLHFVL